MKRTATLTALVIFSLAPAFTWAHPQHDGAGFYAGSLHPFAGLDHLLAMIAVGVWAAQMGGRALWAVPAAFVTSMLVGGMLGFSGIAFPLVEPMVAATVLVAGLLILSGARVSLAYGASLAALFALFHGAAHVADAPVNAALVSYITGFVLTTVLLHLTGIIATLAAHGRAAVLRVAAAPVALTGAWMLVSRLN
jgi:urease accessory protein